MGREYYDGRDNYVIYAEETSYATGGTPAVATNFGEVQGVTLNMNQNLLRTQGIGDGLNAQHVSLGMFTVDGSINTKPVDFTFLQYGVGYRPAAGAGTTAAPYLLVENGTFGYSATTLNTLKIELGAKAVSNHQTKTVDGVVINSWSLTGAIGEELACSINFSGKTVARATSIETYTAVTTRPYVFNGGSVVWGASDVLSITNFSVNCALNPVNPKEIASRFNKSPTMGVRRYDWTLTCLMHFDDTASIMSTTELLNEFFQDTDTPLTSGPITGDALTITVSEGSASGDQNLVVQFEDSFITSWAENPTLEGGQVSVTVSGFSLAGLTDGATQVPLKWWTAT